MGGAEVQGVGKCSNILYEILKEFLKLLQTTTLLFNSSHDYPCNQEYSENKYSYIC